jgi:hypothetical protein
VLRGVDLPSLIRCSLFATISPIPDLYAAKGLFRLLAPPLGALPVHHLIVVTVSGQRGTGRVAPPLAEALPGLRACDKSCPASRLCRAPRPRLPPRRQRGGLLEQAGADVAPSLLWQVYEWRGLRLSVRHNAAAFGGIAKEGGRLTALLPKELRPASLAGSEEAKDEAAEEASQGGNQEGPPQDDEEGGGDGTAEGESVLAKEGGKKDNGEAGAEKEEAAEAEGDTARIERDKGQEQERQAEAGQGGRLQETAQGETGKQGSEEHAGEGAGSGGDGGTGEEQSPPMLASAGPTGPPEEARAPAQGGPQGAAAKVLEKETEEAQGGEATRGKEAGEEGAEGGGSVLQGQPVQDREAAPTKGGEASADGALMAGLEERKAEELREATASPSTIIDDLVGPAARASGAYPKGESAKAEGRGAEGAAEEAGKEVAAVAQGPGRGRGRGRGKRKPEDSLPDATPRRTTRRKR